MKKIILLFCLFFFSWSGANALTEDERVLGVPTPIKGFLADDFSVLTDFSLYQNGKKIISNKKEEQLTTWYSLDYQLGDQSLFLLSKDDIEVPDRTLWIYDGSLHSYEPACNNHPEQFLTDGTNIYYWCEYQCKTQGGIEKLDILNNSSHLIFASTCNLDEVAGRLNAKKIDFIKATKSQE